MSGPTKAVIVAAGLSSRLYPLTSELPKPLLEIGGEPIIRRSVRLLKDHGIESIAVVVGYQREKIQDELGSLCTYIHNPFYSKCNNMGSLWFAGSWIAGEQFLYLHGDIVYNEGLLKRLLREDNPEISLLVDFETVDDEAMKVRVDGRGCLIESRKGIPLDEAHGEWTGILRARENGTRLLFREIDSLLAEGKLQVYDTHAFTNLVKTGLTVGTVPTDGLPWIEIDTEQDLERAAELFGGKDKV